MDRKKEEVYSYSFNGYKFLLKKNYNSKNPRDFIDINYKWELVLQNESMDCITIKTVDKEINAGQLDSLKKNVQNRLHMLDSKVFIEDVLRTIEMLEKG